MSQRPSDKSQRNETLRILLGYLFAFYVVGISFWFMYEAFLNPKTAELPATVAGIIVGGILTIVTGAATFVFGLAAMNAASRASATLADLASAPPRARRRRQRRVSSGSSISSSTSSARP